MNILLTGGTGSFGRSFIVEALSHGDFGVLRVFSRHEHDHGTLRRALPDSRLRWLIGDVRDRDRLETAMRGCEVVVHAAALKCIETGAYDPQEVIKTNVDGSSNVVSAAIHQGVKFVLGISTDKAVNPTTLYGASKLMEEELFLNANSWSPTAFAILRSGNFWQSQGNVFEIWDAQKAQGKPLTLIPGTKRYFIEVEQVAGLAWHLIMRRKPGIYIPKMGEHLMDDCAREMYPGCEIQEIPKRQGEKDREELWRPDESPESHGDYWQISR